MMVVKELPVVPGPESCRDGRKSTALWPPVRAPWPPRLVPLRALQGNGPLGPSNTPWASSGLGVQGPRCLRLRLSSEVRPDPARPREDVLGLSK